MKDGATTGEQRPQALPLPAELGVIGLRKPWASAVVLFRSLV